MTKSPLLLRQLRTSLVFFSGPGAILRPLHTRLVLIIFCVLATNQKHPRTKPEIWHVLSFKSSKLARKTASSDIISIPTDLQIANRELPSQKRVEEKASCAAGFTPNQLFNLYKAQIPTLE